MELGDEGGGLSQPQQQLLCPLSTLRHGHQREEAVLPRGEGLREQPNFPRKDTARSRDIAGVLLANWVKRGDGWLRGVGWVAIGFCEPEGSVGNEGGGVWVKGDM